MHVKRPESTGNFTTKKKSFNLWITIKGFTEILTSALHEFQEDLLFRHVIFHEKAHFPI